MSFGGPYADPIEVAAVEHAVNHGVTLVGSSGNDYHKGNPVMYPAALEGVLGVGAIDQHGSATYFSSSGHYVDLSAPGENVLTTASGGNYRYVDGTSFAAPYVSAAAALVRSANPTLSKAQVDQVLIDTVDHHGHGPGHRDVRYGVGLLRADRAAQVAATMPGGHGIPQQAAPPAQVRVKAIGGASKLHVNVNPNKGRGFSATVDRLDSNGNWHKLATQYRTKGSGETRTINLGKGTYRVTVAAKYGHGIGNSTSVSLRR